MTTKVSSGETPLLPRTEEKVHCSGRTSSRPTPQDSQLRPTSELNSDSFWSFPLLVEENRTRRRALRTGWGCSRAARQCYGLELDVLHNPSADWSRSHRHDGVVSEQHSVLVKLVLYWEWRSCLLVDFSCLLRKPVGTQDWLGDWTLVMAIIVLSSFLGLELWYFTNVLPKNTDLIIKWHTWLLIYLLQKLNKNNEIWWKQLNVLFL